MCAASGVAYAISVAVPSFIQLNTGGVAVVGEWDLGELLWAGSWGGGKRRGDWAQLVPSPMLGSLDPSIFEPLNVTDLIPET